MKYIKIYSVLYFLNGFLKKRLFTTFLDRTQLCCFPFDKHCKFAVLNIENASNKKYFFYLYRKSCYREY